MKVPKNYDVVDKDCIPPDKGTDPCDNPGIEAGISKIKDTPGEMATNSTEGMNINKKQPFGKGGSGYTDGEQ